MSQTPVKITTIGLFGVVSSAVQRLMPQIRLLVDAEGCMVLSITTPENVESTNRYTLMDGGCVHCFVESWIVMQQVFQRELRQSYRAALATGHLPELLIAQSASSATINVVVGEEGLGYRVPSCQKHNW